MDNSTPPPEEERAEEQKKEEEKKKSGPATKIINRANSFQRNARSAKRKLDMFKAGKDAKKMLGMATDPQAALAEKIPGLGGKNGLLKMSKELKTVRRVAQIASKIPPPVWIGIAIALAIILLFFFIVTLIASISGGGGGAGGLGGGNQPPSNNSDGFSRVNGFQLRLACTDEVPTPQTTAECTISYTYDAATANVPLENIIIHFELPTDTVFSSATPQPTTLDSLKYSWPLSNPVNQTAIQVLFANNQPDRFVDALAYISFVDSGPGGGPGGSGTACTAPYEGIADCSVASLSKIFTGDPSRAIAASMICQLESTSNPFVVNDTCVVNGEDDDDYSVGLYQINLIWHACPVAPYAYEYSSPDRCSKLVSQTNRDTCEAHYKNAGDNITKTHQLSGGGVNWDIWSTWPTVRSRLENCGITLQ